MVIDPHDEFNAICTPQRWLAVSYHHPFFIVIISSPKQIIIIFFQLFRS